MSYCSQIFSFIYIFKKIVLKAFFLQNICEIQDVDIWLLNNNTYPVDWHQKKKTWKYGIWPG